MSSEIAKTFPAVNCDAVRNNYGTELQRYAIKDYDFVIKNPGVASSGALKCFCNQEIAKNAEKAYADTYGDPEGRYICWDYQYKVYEVYIMLNSLKYFITGVNYILRTICISLVAWIGYKTETLKLI